MAQGLAATTCHQPVLALRPAPSLLQVPPTAQGLADRLRYACCFERFKWRAGWPKAQPAGLRALNSEWGPCERLSKGREFVAEHANMPEGFCSWAWADIQKYVLTLARGGNMLGVEPGVFVTCCTDGFRPVIFKLERVDSD